MEARTIVLEPARPDPRGAIGIGASLAVAAVLLASWPVLAPLGALRLVALAACALGGVASALRARRRVEHAVVFGEETALVKGVAAFFAGGRRTPYRRIQALERRIQGGAELLTIVLDRAWLPVFAGGGRVAPGAVESVESELRTRIAALPGGRARLARMDSTRRATASRMPWVTLAGVVSLALLFLVLGGRDPLRFATCELLMLTLGLSTECCIGSLRTLLLLALAGAVGAAFALVFGEAAESAASSLAFGLVGLLIYLRAFRERALPLTLRPAVDTSVLLGFALLLGAAFDAEHAELAAFVVALAASPLLLRSWPPAARST